MQDWSSESELTGALSSERFVDSEQVLALIRAPSRDVLDTLRGAEVEFGLAPPTVNAPAFLAWLEEGPAVIRLPVPEARESILEATRVAAFAFHWFHETHPEASRKQLELACVHLASWSTGWFLLVFGHHWDVRRASFQKLVDCVGRATLSDSGSPLDPKTRAWLAVRTIQAFYFGEHTFRSRSE